MRAYLTLLVYLAISLVTGVACYLQLIKYYEMSDLSNSDEFSSLTFIGLLLAFLTSIKELTQAAKVVKETLTNQKTLYFKKKRKEGKIEIEMDDQESNNSIHAKLFKNSFIETTRRTMGDISIGFQYFSDLRYELFLHGKVIGNKKVGCVTFEAYSDTPIITDTIADYLKIACFDKNRKGLNFRIAAINGSLHRFDIIVDLGREYLKSEDFFVTCVYTIPYCLATTGPEYLFSGANYYKIDNHTVEVVFKDNPPQNLTLTILNRKKEYDRIISPNRTSKKKNRFAVEILNQKRESKIKLEYVRKKA